MPLYDYRCKQCGEVFEVKQSFSDELLKTHDTCGGELERLISAPALMSKGTGWYVTDYGRGGKIDKGNGKSEGKTDSGKTDSGKSEPKSESKTESKSDSKTESKPKTETKTESKPAPSKSSSE